MTLLKKDDKKKLKRLLKKINKLNKSNSSVIREFVYLDEVSVYSLLASSEGSIIDTITDSETRSLQEEASGSFGFNTGVINADGKLGMTKTSSTNSQIVRKSIIQSHFDRLFKIKYSSLIIHREEFSTEYSEIKTIEDLFEHYGKEKYKNIIIDPQGLCRGGVIEVEIELSTDTIFQISTLVSSLIEMVNENPALLGISPRNDLDKLQALENILVKLMFGLVPIRGEVKDYLVITSNGKELIVKKEILKQIGCNDGCPLHIVGVADQSLFWKDIRLILFSDTSFNVFCRITNSGLQSSWTPIKMLDVIKSIIPITEENIRAIEFDSFINTTTIASQGKNPGNNQQLLSEALMDFSNLIYTKYKLDMDDQKQDKIARIIEESLDDVESMKGRRKAFDRVSTFICQENELEINPEELADLREQATIEKMPEHQPQSRESEIRKNVETEIKEHHYIETEPIAIYW